MEALYPQNILERKYPILREQREKAEREAVDEKRQVVSDLTVAASEDDLDEEPFDLHANEPLEMGMIGTKLNTRA